MGFEDHIQKEVSMLKKRDFLITRDSIKFYAINDPIGREAIIKIVEKHKNNPAVTLKEKDGVITAVFYYNPFVFGAERKMLIQELITDFKQALRVI